MACLLLTVLAPQLLVESLVLIVEQVLWVTYVLIQRDVLHLQREQLPAPALLRLQAM